MTKKKSFLQRALSFVTSAAMMLTMGVLLTGNTMRAEAADYEYAMFPGSTLKVNQGAYNEYNAYSHSEQNAFDLGGNSNYYAPFSGTITKIYTDFNAVVLQSDNKVYWANGTLDYMSVCFVHDNDISNLKVGTHLNQGDTFYQPGVKDPSGLTTGTHVHLCVNKGKTNKAIPYFSGDTRPNEALFITSSTKITQTGNYKWTKLSGLSSISVTTPPNTTIYEDGSAFSTAGMVVTAKYSDGSSKAVTGYTTSADLSTAGTKNVTISYTESGVTKTTTQSVTVQDLFEGSGTASDPYQIGTTSDLQALADHVNDISANGCYGYAYYIQTADIDLNGIDWIPIGSYYESLESETRSKFAAFNGCYNGNYHKVTNLYMNYSKQYSGLFGRVNYNALTSAVVENLSVSGTVIGGNLCAGGIAGETGYGATIRNCDFTGTVQGTSLVGGITGKLQGGANISNCYANAELTATDDGGNAGGITGGILVGNVASSVDALIENSYFAGTISADQSGGVSGTLEIETVKECTVTFTNNYYLNSAASGAVAGAAQTGCSALSPTLLKESASMLGAVYTDAAEGQNDGYPVFVWQNAPFAGSGTESDPYQISSKEELEKMRDLVNNTSVNPHYGHAYYIQTADIDLENEIWVPIGLGHEGDDGLGAYNNTTRMFYGSYDGNQHSIYNLNADGNWYYAGLFGSVRNTDAVVKNLVVYGYVKGENAEALTGGIAGAIQYGACIENCAFIGDVYGTAFAGGVSGEIWASGNIYNSYHNGIVSSTGSSGGITGTVRFGEWGADGDYSLIENCYHTGGDVTGSTYSGGIIGRVGYYDGISNTITVDNCYFLSGTAANTTNPDATADNTLALTASLMKMIAPDLGAPFTSNTNPKLNDGYPVFEWQLVIAGDVNTDGTLSVLDVVMLQKWLLQTGTLTDAPAGDLNADGILNAFDLGIMKRMLVQ